MAQPNRGTLIDCDKASPVSTSHAPSGWSETLSLAAACHALDRVMNKATHRWQTVETEMMRDPDWAALSQKERDVFPAQVQLAEIERLKDRVKDHQNDFLEALAFTSAKDVSDVVGKLSVVMALMYPDDHPHGYTLIVNAAKTLATVSCPFCNMALAKNEALEMVEEAARARSILR